MIDEGATLGANTRVWHFSHVCAGAQIGENCSLGQNVFIGNTAKIGNNVKIQNNVSIFDNVTLEDNVFCGPSAVFTNVQNPRSLINRKAEYQHTLVKAGATLGANCTIVCGVTIGANAFVGAGAVITKNVLDFALMTGVPARHTGWISSFGERLSMPLTGDGECVCEHTNTRYILVDGQLRIEK